MQFLHVIVWQAERHEDIDPLLAVTKVLNAWSWTSSTDGEGEMSWVAPCDRRALLSPELLLFRCNTCFVQFLSFLCFRAAAAHNLPVMCQAVALGADLEWRYNSVFYQAVDFEMPLQE